MPKLGSWERYQNYRCDAPPVGLSLDISRMSFDDRFLAEMEPRIQEAYAAMEELEGGGTANRDEGRMVGHYWLRAADLAPTPELKLEIESTLAMVNEFAADFHAERKFTDVLCIGIGGSALGPMFVSDALGKSGKDRVRMHFMDNTDPDGIARILGELKGRLEKTLCVVTSKSGKTPETRNGMVLASNAYSEAGLDFAEHAVAITSPKSALDVYAKDWLKRFPMFDWIGGRTSVFSAVGLLPAALEGIDIDGMLRGAAACDVVTRNRETLRNPAALLALMWYHATDGKGSKDMVVLPYKDGLLLFSRYLQQLVMESLGKEFLVDNKTRVEQGITVYGNKGSTDQHAYVQQLREGVNNFFVTFIRVLDAGSPDPPIQDGSTAGDFLHALLLGTRDALSEKGRQSMTITIDGIDAHRIGALIALFERAVGFYATLIGINAYHQPGVEAGKREADAVLSLQRRMEAELDEQAVTAEELAKKLDADPERVQLLLEHLAANGRATRAGEDRFTA